MVSMLSASSFALVSGKFTQVFGPKRVLLVGFSVFALGTIGSFLAKDFTSLLIIRFFQGFGESLLYEGISQHRVRSHEIEKAYT